MQPDEVRIDKIIKLIIVVIILISFVILSSLLAYASMSPTYNIVDEHMLSDLVRDDFTLLSLIVVAYFNKNYDMAKMSQIAQQAVEDRFSRELNKGE